MNKIINKILGGVFLLLLAAVVNAQVYTDPKIAGKVAGKKVALMPLDVELFSISGGGVLEPKADWTQQATQNLLNGIHKRKASAKIDLVEVKDVEEEKVISLSNLHEAVGGAAAVTFFRTVG